MVSIKNGLRTAYYGLRTGYKIRTRGAIQNSNRSDRENWSTSKGGPVFSKLFRLDRTDPLSFGPKFPEILVEWIAPRNLGVRDFILFNLPLFSFRTELLIAPEPQGIYLGNHY